MKLIGALILSGFLLVEPVKKTPYEEYLEMIEAIRLMCERGSKSSIIIRFPNGRQQVFYCT